MCENNRGTTLLICTYKVLSNYIRANEKKYEEQINKYQCGFRSQRLTIDQIFLLQIFIDIKQAVDSINRKDIPKAFASLSQEEISTLVMMTMKYSTNKILIQGATFETFDINSDVR
jgi:Zn-dependent M32 family carboxypeptidase